MDRGAESKPVAVVTGAANGIGEAVARRLAADGYRVLIVDRDAEAGERVAAALPAARFAECDVADPDSLERVAAEAMELGGGAIHGLVNNAGMTMRTGFADSGAADWQRIQEVNMQSVYVLTRACLDGLKAARGGVVSTSSVAGLVGVEGLAAYSATKAGVIGLTRSLALELGAEVRFNAICPGNIATRMMARIIDDEELYAASVAPVPAGRFGEPEEVANVVAWLLSDQASYVNGVVLPVDGGISAGYRD